MEPSPDESAVPSKSFGEDTTDCSRLTRSESASLTRYHKSWPPSHVVKLQTSDSVTTALDASPSPRRR